MALQSAIAAPLPVPLHDADTAADHEGPPGFSSTAVSNTARARATAPTLEWLIFEALIWSRGESFSFDW
jgi:hypothetical protein